MRMSLPAVVSLALFLVTAAASTAHAAGSESTAGAVTPAARVPANTHAPTFGCGTGQRGVVTPRVSQTAQLPSSGATPARRPSSGSGGTKY
jgi:hypothetical protein